MNARWLKLITITTRVIDKTQLLYWRVQRVPAEKTYENRLDLSGNLRLIRRK
jgi:hypothetical protein